MKNKIKPHVPLFIDIERSIPEVEFETTEDLLNLDFVKKWENHPDFVGFQIGDDCLIVVLNGKPAWWVLGFIEYPELVALPKTKLF